VGFVVDEALLEQVSYELWFILSIFIPETVPF
jgi:hypothetical protein